MNKAIGYLYDSIPNSRQKCLLPPGRLKKTK